MPRTLYEKQTWKDLPSEETPINSTRLLHIENGIYQNSEDKALKEIYGDQSINLGRNKESDIGKNSIAAGTNAKATIESSFSFGVGVEALALGACAFGKNSKAWAMYSQARGYGCETQGQNSFAEGYKTKTTVSGTASHSEGFETIANGAYQHVQGMFNIPDTMMQYAHIVGGGNSESERKNIHTLDWQGNAIFSGDVINGNGVSLDRLMALVGTTGQLRTIVEILPETDISTETIYMIPKESSSENDIYNEYINVDGTPSGWEFIGNSAVDLSDYYTADQVDHMLNGYVMAENGKGLSSNDYSDSDRALVASIRSMTTTDALKILNETEETP